jgi:hypothetical protein
MRTTYPLLCVELDPQFLEIGWKGMAAGRKKFLEFSIETDQGKKQKLKV